MKSTEVDEDREEEELNEPNEDDNGKSKELKVKPKEQEGADEGDNRKHQLLYVATILFCLVVAIMTLSIMASNNFGQDQIESFELCQADLTSSFRNQDVLYNSDDFGRDGFILDKTCRFPKRYFTQGLEIVPDSADAATGTQMMLLSAGWRNRSALVLIEYSMDSCSFNVKVDKPLGPSYFAEGCTLIGDTVYQLTYTKNHILEWSLSRPSEKRLKYDLHYEKTHDVISSLGMRQGWGLVYNSHNAMLYSSDGTSTIFEVDASNWETKRTINVTKDGHPVSYINEMELIPDADGRYVVANIFTSNDIYMIDLETGKVVKTWDMSSLTRKQLNHVAA